MILKLRLPILMSRSKLQRSKFIDLSDKDIPVYVTQALNERSYGKLQGRNKQNVRANSFSSRLFKLGEEAIGW